MNAAFLHFAVRKIESGRIAVVKIFVNVAIVPAIDGYDIFFGVFHRVEDEQGFSDDGELPDSPERFIPVISRRSRAADCQTDRVIARGKRGEIDRVGSPRRRADRFVNGGESLGTFYAELRGGGLFVPGDLCRTHLNHGGVGRARRCLPDGIQGPVRVESGAFVVCGGELFAVFVIAEPPTFKRISGAGRLGNVEELTADGRQRFHFFVVAEIERNRIFRLRFDGFLPTGVQRDVFDDRHGAEREQRLVGRIRIPTDEMIAVLYGIGGFCERSAVPNNGSAHRASAVCIKGNVIIDLFQKAHRIASVGQRKYSVLPRRRDVRILVGGEIET